MKIGFDAKRLYCNFTGLGNYSRSLVKNLHQYYPDNEYFLYTPGLKKTPETSFFRDNPSFQTYAAKTRFKSFWRSFSIAKQLKTDEVRLYHGLSNEIPAYLKKNNIKSIVTIHDLIFKTLPTTYPLIDRNIYNQKFRNSCFNADKIIAISKNTKRDLIDYYDIDPDKIEVIYQSCNPLYYTETKSDIQSNDIQKLVLPSEYLLFVGSIERRKNLAVIIEAYHGLSPDFKIPLVVVGEGGSYKKEILQQINAMGLEKKVIWISGLDDNYTLQHIYRKARALIYPSFYEGFGLPVVEALLSKTPVICSGLSSLPEAGGPNSIYVDPTKPEEVSHAITKVLDNSTLRKTMIDRGYDYAINSFSPKGLSEQMISCYKDLLDK